MDYSKERIYTGLENVLERFYGRAFLKFIQATDGTQPLVYRNKIPTREARNPVFFQLFTSINSKFLPWFYRDIELVDNYEHPLNLVPLENEDDIELLKRLQIENPSAFVAIIKALAAEITDILHQNLTQLRKRGIKEAYLDDIEIAYRSLQIFHETAMESDDEGYDNEYLQAGYEQ